MKMSTKWSKMIRIGPRICQNDNIGLNIDFPLSKYITRWSNISKSMKIDPKVSKDSYIFIWFFIWFPIFLYEALLRMKPWGASRVPLRNPCICCIKSMDSGAAPLAPIGGSWGASHPQSWGHIYGLAEQRLRMMSNDWKCWTVIGNYERRTKSNNDDWTWWAMIENDDQ